MYIQLCVLNSKSKINTREMRFKCMHTLTVVLVALFRKLYASKMTKAKRSGAKTKDLLLTRKIFLFQAFLFFPVFHRKINFALLSSRDITI